MLHWMDLLNSTMGVAGLMLTTLGLVLSIVCRPLERWTRGYFITNFSIMIVYTLSVTVSNFAVFYSLPFLLKPSVFMESLSSSLLNRLSESPARINTGFLRPDFSFSPTYFPTF